MRAAWAILFLICTNWITCAPALAQKRVALVIGNSTYQKVARLSNPANDANAVAAMLKSAGFDSVELRLDVVGSELRRFLRDFGDRSREADVAVLYYAGHGLEFDGTNYLIPVDAALERDVDVLDESISLDRLLFAVEPAKQLRLVILDACRDNPFIKTMKRTIAARSVGRGLAKIEPTSPNTLIAYAAKAGSTASDGDGRNSPFAISLIEHLPKPGLDLRRAFGFVRDDVLKSTGNKQEPYVYGSLGGNDVSLVAAKPVVVPTTPQADPQATVRRDYELAMQAGDRDGWEAFIRAYPEGFYADLAKVQLKKIAAEEARTGAIEKARKAQQDKARLATEIAAKAEQEKAAAMARAAEQTRFAAEKAKLIESEKAAAAERARADAERVAAEKAAAEKSNADKAANYVASQAEKSKDQKVTALAPSDDAADKKTSNDLSRSLQAELRRVGCNTGALDGDWNAAARRSLALFNKHAGTKFDIKVASADAFDAVKAKIGRTCPLLCDRGFRADGDRCAKIICRAGFRVNDENECERIPAEKPSAKREKTVPKRDTERNRIEATLAKPQSSGQILCDGQGCRPVKPGCWIAYSKWINNIQTEHCK